jgi:Raf kinase inhibitor-like YbhB/YbcL family protein
MRLTSSAYPDRGTMPARFATVNVAGGSGASVPLAWDDPPAQTRSFAVAMIDIHPVAHDWVHWLVTGIPAETRGIAEGASMTPAMPAGALEHVNTGGRRGYGGPQPPVGSGMHDYVTNVYALDMPTVPVAPDASWETVRAAMSGHVIDNAALVGRFGR